MNQLILKGKADLPLPVSEDSLALSQGLFVVI